MDMDIMYMNFWVALPQVRTLPCSASEELCVSPVSAGCRFLAAGRRDSGVPATRLARPPLAVPPAQNIPVSSTPGNFADGITCVFQGINQANDTGCESAGWKLVIFLGNNILYNILILRVIAKGSAVIMFAASALSVPISLFAFCT